jgi:ABC-type nitrate/sulfonate/bicarbonate transport system ATPase subunit
MVFQEDRLCEQYSAVRNVELVCGDRDRAREALRQLLDEDALDRPCSTLSGGMKRRVALARAVEADSGAVLLDEPFTGMDEETRSRAESYLFSHAAGRTLVIATHNM